MSKLIVFDMDGTFLDSAGFFEEATRKFEKIHNLPETNIEAIHTGYSDAENHDFGWGVSKYKQNDLLEEYWQFLNEEHKSHVPNLCKDVKQTFLKLKEMGYLLSIATSKPGHLFDMVLDDHNIRDFFVSPKSWRDVIENDLKMKPAPDMLNLILKELDIAPEDTLMIGDTHLDVLMAKNAGVKTIAVTWGGQSKESLSEHDPDFIVDTKFSDILPLIEREFPI